MNYQEFKSNIYNNLKSRVDENVSLILQVIPKNNGNEYDGLIIKRPNLNIAPTIYLNPYYHRYLNGMSMEDICEDIMRTYESHLPTEDFDITRFTDYSQVKNRIVFRLVNRKRNQELLEQIPHVPFLDLAVIFYCHLGMHMEGQSCILIHNKHLSLWGITTDQLLALARENTRQILPHSMENLLHVIRELHPDAAQMTLPSNSMYVLSNEFRNFGATAFLYEGLIAECAQTIGSDLIILPSSVHELLLVAADSEEELRHCDLMVQQVNETEIADEEILSDHAYYYNRAEDTIIYYDCMRHSSTMSESYNFSYALAEVSQE